MCIENPRSYSLLETVDFAQHGSEVADSSHGGSLLKFKAPANTIAV